MTPAEIRSLYVEVLARAELASVPFVHPFDGVRSVAMRTNEDAAQAAVAALAAAGLLPTHADRAAFDSNAELAVWINGERVTKQMQRYVGPWREVSE